MLTQETKRKIDTARDILVGKVPDPKAQVEQITTALIYKFMDDMDLQSASLPKGKTQFFTNGFGKYSWSKLMDAKLGGQERLNLYEEAIRKMSTNPHLPQLFRDVFKDAYLPYRDPQTLNLFLKEINGFSYDHSENLGDAFEYLLSILGSQGEAGQFRTPRHIIDFIVEVIDPKKDETILDPACGTAGFLISAYKHILKANEKKRLTPDEKKRLMSNLTGYDISPDMVKLSLVNMYLHGSPSPSIHEYDTLTSDERWNERFDVMMANPPFMSPKGGIRPHKRFMVQANRAEVLFVDYIMEHLNNKGRAGIIVPEGVIFQSAGAYKQLRKLLVADGLYAVVSLPGGVFNPYAGVKTSILFFDNQLSKQSKEILFLKVLNDGFDLGAQRKPIDKNDLPHALEILKAHKESILNKKRISIKKDNLFAWTISKKKIADNDESNLTGEKYLPLKIVNRQWDDVAINDLCEVRKGSAITKKQTASGNVPVIAGGQQPAYYHDVSNRAGNVITVSASGAYAGFVNYFSEPIFASDCTTIQSKNEAILLTRFAYYLLKAKQEYLYSFQQGGGQPHVYPKDLAKIRIPVPPIDVQRQIIAEFDSYQKVIDGANQVIEHHKPSIGFDASWERKKLGEIAKMEYGYTETAKSKGDARYIRITDISNDGHLRADGEKYVNITKASQPYQLHAGDVLVARTGATYGKTMIFSEEYPAVFASFLIRLILDTTKILPEYYWAFAQTSDYWNQAKVLVTGGVQPQFNGNALKHLSIPLPSLEVQKRIVAQVKDEQAHALSARKMIDIYEDKIKKKIVDIWGE